MTRHGFTLAELLVGLVLLGAVVLLGGRLFRAALDGAAAVERHRSELDQQMNAERWLAAALGSVAVGLPGDGAFDGAPTALRCTAWLVTADGWPERRRVTIAERGGRLEAEADGARIILAPHVTGVAFEYLTGFGANAGWVTSWSSPVSAPLAVRLRLSVEGGAASVDTLLLVVGARG